MINDVFGFVNQNAGLGVVGLAIAFAFLYNTKVQKSECSLKEKHVQKQLRNQREQQAWTMDTLFKIAQTHGVQGVNPPPKDEE